MFQTRKERIKSVLLFVLLLASIVQVGILWNVINHSNPRSYLSGILPGTFRESAQTTIQSGLPAGAGIVVSPYTITVSDGEESHYLLPRRSAAFDQMLSYCMFLYEDILTSAPVQELPLEDWGKLVSRKGILMNYKVPIRRDMLQWTIDLVHSTAAAPDEIERLLVTVNEGVGGQSVRLYVRTPSKIVQFSSGRVAYQDLFNLIHDGIAEIASDSLNSTKYKTISEFGSSGFPGFDSDVLCVVEGQKTKMFRKLKYAVPMDIRDKVELENAILGDDVHSYNRSLDYSDTLVFKNITSIYRLQHDGLMEYNYIPVVQDNEKGSLAGAMRNALAFVNRIESGLLGSADLYISGIYEDEDEAAYRFTFDYIMDDHPILFQYTHKQGEQTTIYRNAITVVANEARILSCRWLMVEPYFGNDIVRAQTYFETIDSEESLTTLSVNEISIAYAVDINQHEGDAYAIWPVWALSSPDGSIRIVPMREVE